MLSAIEDRWPATARWMSTSSTFALSRAALVAEGHSQEVIVAAVLEAVMEHRLSLVEPAPDAKQKKEYLDHYVRYYEEHSASPLPSEEVLTAEAIRTRIEAAHDRWTPPAGEDRGEWVSVDGGAEVVGRPVTFLPNQPHPDELRRAGFLGLAYGFPDPGADSLPFIALIYENSYFGRRVFAKIASWADDPAGRRDQRGIVVSFVEEPDGGYTFYLYPGTASARGDDSPTADPEPLITFTVVRKGFAPDERAAFDRVKPHLALGEYILAAGNVAGELFRDLMILKRAPRLLRRDQVGPNDVEQALNGAERAEPA